jgi:succinyl-diaminopimelate desuccinylase
LCISIDKNGSSRDVLRDCIAYGPGILDLAHQPDEYVVIEDMVNSAKVMALAARSLLYGTA